MRGFTFSPFWVVRVTDTIGSLVTSLCFQQGPKDSHVFRARNHGVEYSERQCRELGTTTYKQYPMNLNHTRNTKCPASHLPGGRRAKSRSATRAFMFRPAKRTHTAQSSFLVERHPTWLPSDLEVAKHYPNETDDPQCVQGPAGYAWPWFVTLAPYVSVQASKLRSFGYYSLSAAEVIVSHGSCQATQVPEGYRAEHLWSITQSPKENGEISVSY